jgi:hypothetical protein
LRPVWIAVGVLCAAYLFAAGLLIGREMPAHHFERFGNSAYLFDSSSGDVCKAIAGQNDVVSNLPPGFVPADPNGPKDANGFPIVQSANPIDKSLAAQGSSDPWDKYAVKTSSNQTVNIQPCASTK